MKKYLQSTWMRILSCVLCAFSVVSVIVCGAGLYLCVQNMDMQALYERGCNLIAENYGLYAIHMLENSQVVELKEEFDEKGISCSIVFMTDENTPEGVSQKAEQVFSCGTINTETMVDLQKDMKEHYAYSHNSLLKVLMNYTGVYNGDEYWVQYPIEMVVFNRTSGMFYYQTEIGLFPVKEIDVYTKNVYFDYRLKEINGQHCYYNDYYQIKLDTTQYAIWDSVRIDGYRMKISEDGEYGKTIQLITEPIEREIIISNFYVIYDDIIETNYSEYMAGYQVQISWLGGTSDNPVADSLFTEWESVFEQMSKAREYIVPLLIFSFVMTLLTLGLVIYAAKGKHEELAVMYKIPVFLYTVGVALIEFLLLMLMCDGIFDWMIVSEVGSTGNIVILTLSLMAIMMVLAISWLQNIVTRIKCKCFWRHSEVYYIFKGIKCIWQKVTKPIGIMMVHYQENTALFKRVIYATVLIFFVEFLAMCAVGFHPNGLVIGFFLEKAILISIILYAFWQMSLLQEGSKRIAAGDLQHPIDTNKLKWEFKRHGENINNVSNSIQIAVEERMKSEHFKTELITNVSHDIKTPLTSIINYVDLIKKEEIQDEKVQGYVEVLDRQSARLKKLIEDLMEASKASTGNLAVQLEECDVDVLLTQVVGEFEEKLAKSQLEVVMDRPEHPMKMLVDGRHMWRVLDNLLNNACKYSMPGTRVYVSLKQEKEEAVITFKNISKSALNIPSDELLERFVRGDSSRNTEGSGLGLSIAQSLTELMHGKMNLEIDGDLFKVVLRFPILIR